MSVEDVYEVDKLKRINRALMSRVESAMDQQGNAFSLFQTAINLEGQVKHRTDELTVALRGLERTNSELEIAKESSEIANRSKTRFLAAASHDVLQPLNAATLSISVLADLQETDMGRDLVLQVERSLDTMNSLLKTLVDISKLDAGVVEPRLEAIPLSDIFENLLSDFMPIAEAKKLELRSRYKNANVVSDRTMLRRILQNLISNGIRYTNQGGVILGARLRHGYALIDVVDTGDGIPKDQHFKIFDEFHRGALPIGHDRDAESGLGLGLSIVKRMAASLDHDLTLSSTLGKGTRFRLKVPLANDEPVLEQAPRQKVTSTSSNLEGVKILLIENDPAGIQASISLFESWGCDTRIASTINTTISALSDTNWLPQIIIADLHLDHGDLGTLAVTSAREYIGSKLPAIIITADPSQSLEGEIGGLEIELMQKP